MSEKDVNVSRYTKLNLHHTAHAAPSISTLQLVMLCATYVKTPWEFPEYHRFASVFRKRAQPFLRAFIQGICTDLELDTLSSIYKYHEFLVMHKIFRTLTLRILSNKDELCSNYKHDLDSQNHFVNNIEVLYFEQNMCSRKML